MYYHNSLDKLNYNFPRGQLCFSAAFLLPGEGNQDLSVGLNSKSLMINLERRVSSSKKKMIIIILLVIYLILIFSMASYLFLRLRFMVGSENSENTSM